MAGKALGHGKKTDYLVDVTEIETRLRPVDVPGAGSSPVPAPETGQGPDEFLLLQLTQERMATAELRSRLAVLEERLERSQAESRKLRQVIEQLTQTVLAACDTPAETRPTDND